MSSDTVQTYNTEIEDKVVEANVVVRYQYSFTCNDLMQRHTSVAILLPRCQLVGCFLTITYNMQRMLQNGGENTAQL